MNRIKLLSVLIALLWTTSFSFAQGSGKCLDLNGSSSYATGGIINLSTNTLSFTAWIKVHTFKSGHPYITSIAGIESTSGRGTALLRIGDATLAKEKLQFVLQINGTQRKLDGNLSLTANKWYHVAATYDGSSMKLYINGKLDASMNQTGNISANALFEIGRNYGNSRIMDGEIDELTVWTAALSQSTIRDYMCQSIKSTHPNYSNLQAYWKFDEGIGTSSSDYSSNNRTATLVSSPTWTNSAAPIGNESVHDFSSPFSVKLLHPDGDSMMVDSVIGTLGSLHLYRIDTTLPNSTTGISPSVVAFDSTRYWGVYFADGSSADARIRYFYDQNSSYQNASSCVLEWSKRDDNADLSWASAPSARSATTLTLSRSKAGEFLLGFGGSSAIHSTPGDTICLGDSVTLQHTTSGLTYTWLRNGAVIPGSTNQYQAKVPGVYQVISTINNCNDTSTAFTLGTVNLPTVSFSALTPVCADLLFDTINGGAPAGGKYLHTFMSGNLFVVQNAGPGDHRIVYEYTDANGCSDTASQVLKVHPLPTITLSTLAPLCEDSSAFALTNGQPTGGTYEVNGNTQTQFDATVLGSGTHQVKYSYVDANQCPNSDSIDVIVNALPNVTLSLINDEYCEYESSKLMDGQNPRGGAFTGTGVVGNQWEPQKSGAGAHPVTYTYTDPATGCSNVDVDTMYIHARPAKPTVTQIDDSLKTDPGNAYQWYNLQRKINGATDQAYKPLIDNEYYVIITSAEGCVSLPSDTFDYKKPTGLAEWEGTSGMRVFPNPADQQVQLQFEGNEIPQRIELLDLQGKQLLIESVSSASITLSLSDLDAGVYVIRAWFENKMVPVRIQKR